MHLIYKMISKLSKEIIWDFCLVIILHIWSVEILKNWNEKQVRNSECYRLFSEVNKVSQFNFYRIFYGNLFGRLFQENSHSFPAFFALAFLPAVDFGSEVVVRFFIRWWIPKPNARNTKIPPTAAPKIVPTIAASMPQGRTFSVYKYYLNMAR